MHKTLFSGAVASGTTYKSEIMRNGDNKCYEFSAENTLTGATLTGTLTAEGSLDDGAKIDADKLGTAADVAVWLPLPLRLAAGTFAASVAISGPSSTIVTVLAGACQAVRFKFVAATNSGTWTCRGSSKLA